MDPWNIVGHLVAVLAIFAVLFFAAFVALLKQANYTAAETARADQAVAAKELVEMVVLDAFQDSVLWNDGPDTIRFEWTADHIRERLQQYREEDLGLIEDLAYALRELLADVSEPENHFLADAALKRVEVVMRTRKQIDYHLACERNVAVVHSILKKKPITRTEVPRSSLGDG